MKKKVLAVETSCDDTCVSVVREDGFVESFYRQDQDQVHKPFGGIVPERASRNHSQFLLPLIHQALKQTPIEDISLLACTNRPGLLGSLMVGTVTVKTLSVLLQKPCMGVNHIEGHILSPFLYDHHNKPLKDWDFPYIALVVSGGHTHLFLAEKLSHYLLLGQTLDDAAGEAFDKFARLLGLPYPGGVFVDQLAKKGVIKNSFPVALKKKGSLNFSFSGLKTSAYLRLKKLSPQDILNQRESLCADYQEAIVDQILFKLDQCTDQFPHIQRLAVVGGVSANSRLRERSCQWAKQKSLNLALPPLKYCVDNASMIGYAGLQRFLQNPKQANTQFQNLSRSEEHDFIKRRI